MRRVPFWMLTTLLAGCAGSTGWSGHAALPEAGETVWIPGRVVEEMPLAVRRPLEPVLDAPPLTPIARSHPRVGDLRGEGSLSIGSSTDGFVVGCRHLPLTGPHHRMLAVQSRRGTDCGTDELVDAVLRAARDVSTASPGAVLTVGNLAREGGGRVPWSVSHRTGRDADLGFYLRGPDGRQHVPPDMYPLGPSGSAIVDGVPVRFDVARNWLLVRSLLQNRDVSVQWIFVSLPLRKMLLDHAKRLKEPRELIARADLAMAQPHRSRPHDDHFHVRLYCSKDDVLEGCRDTGSNRPWFRDRGPEIARRARELTGLSRSTDGGTRADALTVLGRLARPDTRPAILAGLNDPEPAVRVAAAGALPAVGLEGAETRVAAALRGLPEDGAVLALLSGIESRLAPQVRAVVLRHLLSVERPFVADLGVFQAPWTVASWSAAAIARLEPTLAARTLVEGLAVPGADVAAVDAALRIVTSASPAAADAPAPERVAAWRGWWAGHGREPPLRWSLDALVDAGVLEKPSVPSLAEVPQLLLAARRQPALARAAIQVTAAAVGRRFGRLPLDGIEPLADLAARALSALPFPAATCVDGATAGGD